MFSPLNPSQGDLRHSISCALVRTSSCSRLIPSLSRLSAVSALESFSSMSLVFYLDLVYLVEESSFPHHLADFQLFFHLILLAFFPLLTLFCFIPSWSIWVLCFLTTFGGNSSGRTNVIFIKLTKNKIFSFRYLFALIFSYARMFIKISVDMTLLVSLFS